MEMNKMIAVVLQMHLEFVDVLPAMMVEMLD
jgi:hypothetical protein